MVVILSCVQKIAARRIGLNGLHAPTVAKAAPILTEDLAVGAHLGRWPARALVAVGLAPL